MFQTRARSGKFQKPISNQVFATLLKKNIKQILILYSKNIKTKLNRAQKSVLILINHSKSSQIQKPEQYRRQFHKPEHSSGSNPSRNSNTVGKSINWPIYIFEWSLFWAISNFYARKGSYGSKKIKKTIPQVSSLYLNVNPCLTAMQVSHLNSMEF